MEGDQRRHRDILEPLSSPELAEGPPRRGGAGRGHPREAGPPERGRAPSRGPGWHGRGHARRPGRGAWSRSALVLLAGSATHSVCTYRAAVTGSRWGRTRASPGTFGSFRTAPLPWRAVRPGRRGPAEAGLRGGGAGALQGFPGLGGHLSCSAGARELARVDRNRKGRREQVPRVGRGKPRAGLGVRNSGLGLKSLTVPSYDWAWQGNWTENRVARVRDCGGERGP